MMQQALDRIRRACAHGEALIGLFTKRPGRFVPVAEMSVVCVEREGGGTKIHCSSVADVGTSLVIGDCVGRAKGGIYKNRMFLRSVAAKNPDVGALFPAGVSKIAVAGDTPETFRESSYADVSTVERADSLAGQYDKLPVFDRARPPVCYVHVFGPDVFPGRQIDRQVVATSKFRFVPGVPVAPRDGVVHSVSKDMVRVGFENIKVDARKLEIRALKSFGPVKLDLFPCVVEGEHVKAGQPIFSLFPKNIKEADVEKLPNARVVRWLVLQEQLVTVDGMTLAPMSCVSDDSSKGGKFVDMTASVAAMRVSVRNNKLGDPLRVDDGGVLLNFRFTWHRQYLLHKIAEMRSQAI